MTNRWLLGIALCGALACSTDTTGSGSVNVTGTYKGTLTMAGGNPPTAAITLALTQTGTNVTGTLSFDGDNESAPVTGTLTGSSLSLLAKTSQNQFDDCHLYPWTWNFNVSGNDLVVSSVSGVDCIGDGKGGHSALKPIGTITGTMKKQ